MKANSKHTQNIKYMRFQSLKLILVLVFVCLVSESIAVEPGTLDRSFSRFENVKRTELEPGPGNGNCIAIQRDGKILVAGTRGGDFGVARYLPNGNIDLGFGTRGLVVTDFFGGEETVSGILVDSLGRIIVVGTTRKGVTEETLNYDFAIARYDRAGRLDGSFGTKGKVTTSLGGQGDTAMCAAIYPDGRIVVGGFTSQGMFPGQLTYQFAVVRYATNGDVDLSFGSNGKAVTAINGYEDIIYGIAIQNDGKVVTAGHTVKRTEDSAELNYDIALVRYNDNGRPDETFGTEGVVVADFSGYTDQALCLALGKNGRIFVGGLVSRTANAADSAFALFCYSKEGRPDETFNNNGLFIHDIPESSDAVLSIATLEGGCIIGGTSQPAAQFPMGTQPLLMYIRPDGKSGKHFGTDGIAGLGELHESSLQSICMQADGKILVANYNGNAKWLSRWYGPLEKTYIKMLSQNFVFSCKNPLPARIEGAVIDLDAGPVPGMEVFAIDSITRSTRSVGKTDERGRFYLNYTAEELRLVVGKGERTPGSYAVELVAGDSRTTLAIHLYNKDWATKPLDFTPVHIGEIKYLTQVEPWDAFTLSKVGPSAFSGELFTSRDQSVTMLDILSKELGDSLIQMSNDPSNRFVLAAATTACALSKGRMFCRPAVSFIAKQYGIELSKNYIKDRLKSYIDNAGNLTKEEKEACKVQIDLNVALIGMLGSPGGGGTLNTVEETVELIEKMASGLEIGEATVKAAFNPATGEINCFAALASGFENKNAFLLFVIRSPLPKALFRKVSLSGNFSGGGGVRARGTDVTDFIAQSGVVNIFLSPTGRFTCTLRFGNTRRSLMGQFSAAGEYATIVDIPRLGRIPLSLRLDTSTGISRITGAFGTLSISLFEASYRSTQMPVEDGLYTMLLRRYSTQDAGSLAGYITFKIGRGGTLRGSGRLDNGHIFSLGSILTSGRENGPQASVGIRTVKNWFVGVVIFRDLEGSDCDGNFEVWESQGKVYNPRNWVDALGSRFVVEKNQGVRELLGFSSSASVVIALDSEPILEGNVSFNAFGAPYHVSLLFKVDVKRGEFRGSWKTSSVQPPLNFRGVFFQKGNFGEGFLTVPTNGLFLLHANAE